MSAKDLPDSRTLIEAARAAMNAVQPARGDTPDAIAAKRRQAASRALDAWAPHIDELADFAGVAAFLGLKGPNSLKRNAYRIRSDGSRMMPDPDATFGRTPAFKYRSIVLSQAEAPGRGHPAMLHGPRPGPADYAVAYEAYLRNDGNLDATAKELSLQPATVTRRIARHQALAGQAGELDGPPVAEGGG
jgi:hypothetical protein